MLSEDLKIEKIEKKEYPLLPENVYQVELLDITLKKDKTYDCKMGKTVDDEFENQLSFQFVLLFGKDKEEDLRGRNIWGNFITDYLYISNKGKNKLYQIIEALLSRELTREEEFDGIDGKFLNNLIGKQCRVGVKHKKNKAGDKTFENIETYYVSEEDKTALTLEEKEKATVKKDKEEVKSEDIEL